MAESDLSPDSRVPAVSAKHSVTIWLQQMRSSNDHNAQTAAQDIWDRYCDRLMRHAKKYLSVRVRSRVDEEDVLQSVFASFAVRYKGGGYLLNDRTDLWNLLVSMTANKAINKVKEHTRQKRNVNKQSPGGQAGGSCSDEQLDPMDYLAAAEPTPADAMEFAESVDGLLGQLPEDLRQIAIWRLEGYTDNEISQKLGCSVRTVERKINRIRSMWESLVPPGDTQGD